LKSFDNINRGVICTSNFLSGIGISGYKLSKQDEEIII